MIGRSRSRAFYLADDFLQHRENSIHVTSLDKEGASCLGRMRQFLVEWPLTPHGMMPCVGRQNGAWQYKIFRFVDAKAIDHAKEEFDLSERTNNPKLKIPCQTQALASRLAACLVGDRIYEIRTTARFMEACGKIAAFVEGLPDQQR
jgi:hypothetical protein